MPVPKPPQPQLRHQRINGAARLAFGKDGITDLYQRAPCRFLFPAQVRGGFIEAVSITTSGGLTGGDTIAIEISVAPDSCGTVTTQAAEKLYRVLPSDPPIAIDTKITVGAGGRFEWLAQEAIAFDQTRVRRTVDARLAKDATFLGVESIVLGRGAMGETYESGLIHDAWRIWRADQLIWADALHLSGDIAALNAAAFHLGGVQAMSTIVYAGTDAAEHLALARDLTQGLGGATLLPGLLILRFVHADPHFLRGRVMAALGALRAGVYALPQTLPTVWTC